ncbi:unnamed protein product [Lactuca virosa]|uniref:Uncharacterized protein n=1 Tax=Lactuca virosa TaxID=75947 RepID=A0AAU9LSA5_9ASTR|nr:unnamed protein product [Lactuca virosa]
MTEECKDSIVSAQQQGIRGNDLAKDTEVVESSTVVGVAATTQHGIEVVVEFKTVDHPTELLDHDRPTTHCLNLQFLMCLLLVNFLS